MNSKLRVLFTSCGHEAFEGVCESLRENGEREITIVGADMKQDAYGLYIADKGYLVPPENDPTYLDVIQNICKEERIDILYPLAETAQEFFTTNAQHFSIPVLVQTKENLRIARNKFLLSIYCAERGIPAPSVYRANNWQDILDAAQRLGYPKDPFVLKLDEGAGTKGLKIVYEKIDPAARYMDKDNRVLSLEELNFHLSKMDTWPQMHAAEYLPGDEYSVDVLCLEGKVYSAVVRKRYSAIYGSSKFAEVVKDEELRELSGKVAQHLKLNYIVNLQWRRDTEGTPKIMEINPRIPATIHQTVKAGVNMPYLAVKLALKESITVPEPKFGMCVLKYYGSVFVDKGDLKT